jgi:hypothetical protein
MSASLPLLAALSFRPAGLSRLAANLAQAPAAKFFSSRASPNLAAHGGEFFSLRRSHALHTHLAADFSAEFAQGNGGWILLGHSRILPRNMLDKCGFVWKHLMCLTRAMRAWKDGKNG